MEYYNYPEFKDANSVFEEYLSTLTFIKMDDKNKSCFNITTMTATCLLFTNIITHEHIKKIYDNIEITDEIIYIQLDKNNIKGNKKKKEKKYIKDKPKTTNDKRKKNKGSPFSNQISIGIKNSTSNTNNSICMKIFNNGKIHLTGCKSIDEIKYVFNKIKNIIQKIIPSIELYDFKEDELNIVMANGTYYCGFELDLINLRKIIRKKFTEDEMFIKR